MRNKNYMIISIGTEKSFDKNQHSFVIKPLKKLGLRETYHNTIQVISDKPKVNITLNEEKVKFCL
jgi:hypothetical protein